MLGYFTKTKLLGSVLKLYNLRVFHIKTGLQNDW